MDKLMMNKLDDMEMELDDKEMELDDKEMGMVAGGRSAFGKDFKRRRVRRRKRYLKTFIDNCAEGVDNLLIKVFGPPRKR